jgi:hypothetical protein
VKSTILILGKYIRQIEGNFGVLIELCNEMILVSRDFELFSVQKDKFVYLLRGHLRDRFRTSFDELFAELTDSSPRADSNVSLITIGR